MGMPMKSIQFAHPFLQRGSRGWGTRAAPNCAPSFCSGTAPFAARGPLFGGRLDNAVEQPHALLVSPLLLGARASLLSRPRGFPRVTTEAPPLVSAAARGFLLAQRCFLRCLGLSRGGGSWPLSLEWNAYYVPLAARSVGRPIAISAAGFSIYVLDRAECSPLTP